MGISMAFMTAMKGYKMVLTRPSYSSMEGRAFGADLILTDPTKGMEGTVHFDTISPGIWKETLGNEGSKNLSYVGGDMFKSIPCADTTLLKWILHDWSDEECIKILKKCKEAIPRKEKGGKVFIIDMVLWIVT
uniref:Resveratrol O-methyltransferase n=1 Tax=Solanum tuberosum TaxID=4113 RepID=M1D3K7_SOLTU